ncbi:beta-ketoacyl-[acyl-carrier-protein] synthase family protein [Thermodesulfovibrio sp. 3907-1M]|uniref:Beta-ketoacyl-[acyl-carrier-protein] synthase family protein n=1 Tax=Thermodesulfovibrio autotrophicus TaxID=3118333 RepID=A0AAU8GX73_9BACT
MKQKAVITGMNLITPLGVSLDICWRKLVNGESGISQITFFNPENNKCQIAGQCNDFSAEEFLDKKIISRYDRMFHFFISVALLTAETSGFKPESIKDPFRFSIIGASAIGCPATFEKNYGIFTSKGPKKVSPFCILNLAANPVAGEVARIFNARGPQYFLQEACAAGTKAIGLATKLIQMGIIDIAMVIGADAGITPTIIASLENIGAIAGGKGNIMPQQASRPFDSLRCGFVPSEGAGCVIVESYDHALKRGAIPLAEVAGFGATCDAYHPTAPEPQALSIAECMKMALQDARASPEEIDCINAHGTSTVLNDLTETVAIKKVFKEHAYRIPISANKSMIGHMWGAAGVVETIFSVKTIIEGIIPPTINLENPDPDCDLDYVPNKARKKEVNTVLKNSFGFGGINASLVLKKI